MKKNMTGTFLLQINNLDYDKENWPCFASDYF